MTTIKEFLQISDNNTPLYQARIKSTHHITEKRFTTYKHMASDRILIYISDPKKRPPKNPINYNNYNLWLKIGNSRKAQITPGKMELLINGEDTHGHHYIIVFDGVIIWE